MARPRLHPLTLALACTALAAVTVLDTPSWLTPEGGRGAAALPDHDPDAAAHDGGLAAKRRVVADLSAGRLSLAEAVVRFRAIDDLLPAPVRAVLRDSVGEPTDGRYAGRIYAWAVSHLEDRPEGPAVLDRLAVELGEYLGDPAE